MNASRGDQETRDQEGRDRRRRNIRITVRDVIEHVQPEERVADLENDARHHGRPERRLPVGGEREPEERDREEPHQTERQQETCLGPAMSTAPGAVTRIRPCLQGREDNEHDDDTDDEIEISQVGVDVAGREVVSTRPAAWEVARGTPYLTLGRCSLRTR